MRPSQASKASNRLMRRQRGGPASLRRKEPGSQPLDMIIIGKPLHAWQGGHCSIDRPARRITCSAAMLVALTFVEKPWYSLLVYSQRPNSLYPREQGPEKPGKYNDKLRIHSFWSRSRRRGLPA